MATFRLNRSRLKRRLTGVNDDGAAAAEKKRVSPSKMLDKSAANLKKGLASAAIDLSPFVKD